MDKIKVWPHLTIVAILCAMAAGTAVALWIKHQRTVAAEALPGAARIERIDGEVAINNLDSSQNDALDARWTPATRNQPFSVGDRIYTRDRSYAGLAISGRNFVRLNPNSSLDLLALADRRTQLALRSGSAIFDVGYLAPGEFYEVATPYGAVDLYQPGLYNVGLSDEGAIISVLSGLAQVVGLGGSGQISKGEMLTLLGQTAANIVLSRLSGNDAGHLLDDYYGYQYPDLYDGRYRDYNSYLNDPYYYDLYRRNVSYRYVSSYIPGLNDLDYYGDWYNLNGYGYAWRPNVDSSWVPYQQGYWMTDYPYGPTWVSAEPWGYAPYHYGRWAYSADRWYWIPDSIDSRPIYSPALVAFIPQNQSNEIGWVPLAPGDTYVPRYYDEQWQPTYLKGDDEERRFRNLEVPDAVSIVRLEDFDRPIDRSRVRKLDSKTMSQLNPVLDPLALTPLRNAAIRSAWGRGKIDLPPGISKKIVDTPVLTSVEPSARWQRRWERSSAVRSISDGAKGKRLQVRDERNEKEERQILRNEELRARSLDFARPRELRAREEQNRIREDGRRKAQQRERTGSESGKDFAVKPRQQSREQVRQKQVDRQIKQDSNRPDPGQVRQYELPRREQNRSLERQNRQAQIEQWRSRQTSSPPAIVEQPRRDERKQDRPRNNEPQRVLRQQVQQEQRPKKESAGKNNPERGSPNQTSQSGDRPGKGKGKRS